MTAQGLVDRLLPALSFALPPSGERLDPADLFPTPRREIWLEVGFGGGEHLAWQAVQHPDVGLIGAEVFLNGIASLLGHVETRSLTNVRLYAEDVRPLLACLRPASLSRLFLLFPDPWPKSRHVERRFLCHANLDLLAPLLRPGAELRIATDDDIYKQWAREVMAGRRDFQDITGNPMIKPEAWPETRYEAKARKAGRTPIFLSYRRVSLD